MRETSGRLEETPGEEGSPAYFDSSIKGVYESTGALKTNDGSARSLTNDRHGVARGRQLRRVGDAIGAWNSGDLHGTSSARAGKRAYLARDPFCRRMSCDVDPDKISTIQPEDDEG